MSVVEGDGKGFGKSVGERVIFVRPDTGASVKTKTEDTVFVTVVGDTVGFIVGAGGIEDELSLGLCDSAEVGNRVVGNGFK